jgi:hypothetical protein
MKATIKILTAEKEFSSQDMDIFRRVMNVLRAHDLAVSLTIKKKVEERIEIHKSKLKAV